MFARNKNYYTIERGIRCTEWYSTSNFVMQTIKCVAFDFDGVSNCVVRLTLIKGLTQLISYVHAYFIIHLIRLSDTFLIPATCNPIPKKWRTILTILSAQGNLEHWLNSSSMQSEQILFDNSRLIFKCVRNEFILYFSYILSMRNVLKLETVALQIIRFYVWNWCLHSETSKCYALLICSLSGFTIKAAVIDFRSSGSLRSWIKWITMWHTNCDSSHSL